jgi:Zn-dependent peptidase ImmA (M78 family)
MAKYRKGFPGEAESIAEEIRKELGIGNINRLDPTRLADHLDIPVWSLTLLQELSGHVLAMRKAIAVLHGPEESSLSAITVFRGTERVIVFNEQHGAVRQASDICHELAHGLLLHPPTPAFSDHGCRSWNTEIEDEANYLGGALLIPGKGARWMAKCGLSSGDSAARFGCSLEMVAWRLNASGARRFMKE